MKKACLVLVILLPFVALMATPVTQVSSAATNLNTDILWPADLNPALMPEEVMLIEDEGTPVDNGLLMAIYDRGEKLAVKLTPPSYPFELTHVAHIPVVWTYDTNYTREFDVVIYKATFAGGPGDELGRKAVSPYTAADLNWYDISDQNITITSGSFFFAMECTYDPPFPDSLPAYPTTWTDLLDPLHHVSWGYISLIHPDSAEPFHDWISFDHLLGGGPGWPPGKVIGDSIDLIMRAGGDATGIGEVVLGPQGVISITPEKSLITASENYVNYSLPHAGNTEITVWDGLGRRVAVLYDGYADAGDHNLRWDSATLPRGTYFVYLKAGDLARTARVVLVD